MNLHTLHRWERCSFGAHLPFLYTLAVQASLVLASSLQPPVQRSIASMVCFKDEKDNRGGTRQATSPGSLHCSQSPCLHKQSAPLHSS